MLGYFGSIKGIHLTPVQSLGLVLALVVLNRNPTGLYKWSQFMVKASEPFSSISPCLPLLGRQIMVRLTESTSST